jgi:peroxiredoxin
LIKAKKLTFQILSDPGNQIAAQFGLVHTLPEKLRTIYLKFDIDLPRYNADDSWTLPLAARFIIDRQAIIRYAETDADYTKRPEPEETLKELEALKN